MSENRIRKETKPSRSGVQEMVGSREHSRRVYYLAAGLFLSMAAVFFGVKMHVDDQRSKRHPGNKDSVSMEGEEAARLLEQKYPKVAERLRILADEGETPEEAAKEVSREYAQGKRLNELFGLDVPYKDETIEEAQARVRREKAAQKQEDQEISQSEDRFRAALNEEVEAYLRKTGLDTDPRTEDTATKDRPLITVSNERGEKYKVELMWRGRGGSGKWKTFEFYKDVLYRSNDEGFKAKYGVEPLMARFTINYNYTDRNGTVWQGDYFTLEEIGLDADPAEMARELFAKFLKLAFMTDREALNLTEQKRAKQLGIGFVEIQ